MAVFCFGTASAQEGIDDTYVDLSVNFDEISGSKYLLQAVNRGTADAVGVRVRVLLTNSKRAGTFGAGSQGRHGLGTSYSSIQSNGDGDLEGTWEIGTLRSGPENSKKLYIVTSLDNTRDTNATYMMAKYTATISSETSERAEFLRDNTAVAWEVLGPTNVRGLSALTKAGVMVSVDDQNPQPEGSVKFTLVVDNSSPHGSNGIATVTNNSILNSIVDVEASVRLGRGLEFVPGWVPNPSQGTFSTSTTRSGTWDVGELLSVLNDYGTLEIQAKLTTDSLADIPLEERCISAWVSDMTPPPDPDSFMGRLTACLGDDPPVLFESGDLNLPTLYPCVGVSTSTPPYPCRNEDNDNSIDSGLELVVSAPLETHSTLRAHGVGRFDTGQATSSPKAILRPKNVIIQVKDPGGASRRRVQRILADRRRQWGCFRRSSEGGLRCPTWRWRLDQCQKQSIRHRRQWEIEAGLSFDKI